MEVEIARAPFTGEAKLCVDLPEDAEPIDFFRLFVDESMIELMVEQTNVYVGRKLREEESLAVETMDASQRRREFMKGEGI